MEVEVEKERHPFRFMFKLLVFAGVLYLAGKMLAEKKDEYYGISESEARSKIESKLGPRVGEQKATDIADQVIPVLKDRGVIKADIDVAAEASTEAADLAGEAATKAEEAAEKAEAAADAAAEAVADDPEETSTG